jgi:hypothetical protein
VIFWLWFYAEIMRVSSIVHNHGFGDFDRHRFRSPSPMSSPNPRSSVPGNGFSPWSGLQEVTLKNVFATKCITLLYFIHKWMCFSSESPFFLSWIVTNLASAWTVKYISDHSALTWKIHARCTGIHVMHALIFCLSQILIKYMFFPLW